MYLWKCPEMLFLLKAHVGRLRMPTVQRGCSSWRAVCDGIWDIASITAR